MENETLFSQWLNDELGNRDWSQADLARNADVSRAAISNVINGMRQAGPELCESIARAFGYPPEKVFRAAGLLPAKPELEFEEWRYILSQLPERDRQELLVLARARLEKADQELNKFLDAYDNAPKLERSKVMAEITQMLEELGFERTK